MFPLKIAVEKSKKAESFCVSPKNQKPLKNQRQGKKWGGQSGDREKPEMQMRTGQTSK